MGLLAYNAAAMWGSGQEPGSQCSFGGHSSSPGTLPRRSQREMAVLRASLLVGSLYHVMIPLGPPIKPTFKVLKGKFQKS